jgi:hypothetical protein
LKSVLADIDTLPAEKEASVTDDLATKRASRQAASASK